MSAIHRRRPISIVPFTSWTELVAASAGLETGQIVSLVNSTGGEYCRCRVVSGVAYLIGKLDLTQYDGGAAPFTFVTTGTTANYTLSWESGVGPVFSKAVGDADPPAYLKAYVPIPALTPASAVLSCVMDVMVKQDVAAASITYADHICAGVIGLTSGVIAAAGSTATVTPSGTRYREVVVGPLATAKATSSVGASTQIATAAEADYIGMQGIVSATNTHPSSAGQYFVGGFCRKVATSGAVLGVISSGVGGLPLFVETALYPCLYAEGGGEVASGIKLKTWSLAAL